MNDKPTPIAGSTKGEAVCRYAETHEIPWTADYASHMRTFEAGWDAALSVPPSDAMVDAFISIFRTQGASTDPGYLRKRVTFALEAALKARKGESEMPREPQTYNKLGCHSAPAV